MKQHNTTREYIAPEGQKGVALTAAFEWLRLKMLESPSDSALLAIPAKDDLNGAVADVLDPHIVRALAKNNRAHTTTGNLGLLTEKIKQHFWTGPILVIYPTPKLLDSVDSLRSPSAVLVLPHCLTEIQQWVKTWGARELGAENVSPQKTMLDPEVRSALDELNRLNRDSGLIHPQDRSTVSDTFRSLRGKGVAVDPAEVRAYLMSELGWQPRDADAVADMATKFLTR